MLHPIVRWLARRSIRWFYRDARFANASAIPASGPTLIIASHGNDLPDILMTFLATNRDVLFVANIAAADSPMVRWTYRGLGVIPVSRVKDARALKARGEDAASLNANAFLRVVEALKAGHAVAIFPEGNVHEAPHLGTLRTGAAQMALQAIDRGVPSLCVVPIGYQYENAQQPRSGLLGVVGTPTELAQWKPQQPERRITELTQFFRAQLKQVTRNARSERDATLVARLAAAAGAALSTDAESPMQAAHVVQRLLSKLSAPDEVYVAYSIAPSAAFIESRVHAFEQAAQKLSELCVQFGANAWSARDHADVLYAAGDSAVAPRDVRASALWALSPLAAFAWAWHALPWWICRTVAVRSSPIPVELAARTLVPGLYFMVLWYVCLPLALLLAGVTPWMVLLLFIAQPRLGDFALSWRDRFRAYRLVRGVRAEPAATRRAMVAAAVEVRSTFERLREATRGRSINPD